jgi:hypothetical protein
MLKHVYILNYYTFNTEKKKVIGEDIVIGYFTDVKLAINELKKIIANYPNQTFDDSFNYWWILRDGNWDHVYEIIEVDLNTTSYSNSIRRKMNLKELAGN